MRISRPGWLVVSAAAMVVGATVASCSTPGGNELPSSSASPSQSLSAGPWKQISVGSGFTCGVSAPGAAFCWGRGLDLKDPSHGYGGGFEGNADRPVKVPGFDRDVASVSAGADHTCVVTATGGAYCWGTNAYGQLGTGTRVGSSIPAPVTGLGAGVAAISVGTDHTCAAMIEGGAYCWGRNASGQLGNGTTTDALTPVHVVGLPPAVGAISAGTDFTCATSAAGAARCWGSNATGRLGTGALRPTKSTKPVLVAGLGTGVTSLSAGNAFACAVVGGSVKCWGQGNHGELGSLEQDVSATPVAVTVAGTGALAVDAGTNQACAVVAASSPCWGGYLSNLAVPDARVVSAGNATSCAVTITGRGICWGDNQFGQLGNGSTVSSTTPVQVAAPK
ncbi:MAG: hypothetical protein WCP28_17180 [Actinomycetes bacterium]